MNKYVSRGLWCALFVGGLTVFGATAANAADTGGDDGLLSGNQVLSSITAPVTVTDNAVSVLGDSSSTDSAASGTSSVRDAGTDLVSTGGEDGVASGNQVAPDVVAPVVVGGNAVSVLGDSSSSDSTSDETTSSEPSAGVENDSDAVRDDGLLRDNRLFALGPLAVQLGTYAMAEDASGGSTDEPATSGSNSSEAEGSTELETEALDASATPVGVVTAGELSTQALADTGGDIGTGATAAALLLSAGLALTAVARRKSIRL